MNRPPDLPVLRQVQRDLTEKYGRALLADCPATDQPHTPSFTDLYQALVPLPMSERWEVWHTAEATFCGVLKKLEQRGLLDRSHCHDGTMLVHLALHCFDGQPALVLPWTVLETISCLHIDPHLLNHHLASATLPPTLWMEWDSPPPALPPWIASTRGLLLSRHPLFEAPREHRRVIAVDLKHTKRSSDDLQRFIAFVEESLDRPHVVVYAIVARCHGNRYEYVPCLLGHQRDTPVRDLLVLAYESCGRDNRRTKETEQVWANVAARLMLFTAARGLQSPPCVQRVLPEALAPLKGLGGLFTTERDCLRLVPQRAAKQLFHMEH